MKNLVLTTALALLSLGANAQAPDLPYSQSFESGFGNMTVINKDEASPQFISASYGGYIYSNGISYSGNANYAVDDYVVSPALNVEAGKVYTVSILYKSSTAGRTHNISFVGGTSTDALTTILVPEIGVEKGSDFETFSGKFTASVSGAYYIALHLTSTPGTGTIYFDNFEVSTGMFADAPSAVSGLTANATVQENKFVVALSCTAPTLTYAGTALEGTMTIKAIRNDNKVVYTADNVAAGAAVTFVDNEPLETNATYTVTASNTTGSSPVAQVSVSPTFATPLAATGLAAAIDGENILVTWDAVTQATSTTGIFIANDVRYTVQRNIGTTKTNIAKDLEALSILDPITMPEEGQDAVTYTVWATYKGKSSAAAVSDQVIVGNAYQGEYADSFSNYSYDTKTWITTPGSSVWSCTPSSSYSPVCDPQDGDNGMLAADNHGSDNVWIASPLINVTGMKNPRVDFYVFQDNSLAYTNSIIPKVRLNGEDIVTGEEIVLNGAEKGWHKYGFFLPEEAKTADFRIVFDATADGYAKVCIDNVTIKDILDNNLAITALEAPKTAKLGETVSLNATVTNKGANAAETFSVEFALNGSVIGSVEGSNLAADAVTTLSLPFDVAAPYASQSLEFTATLVYTADQSDLDNSATATVEVGTNDYPLPQTLTAIPGANDITLIWTRPEISTEAIQEQINETFEAWESGSTEATDEWIFIDVDGAGAKGFGGVNEQSAMAAMVAENVNYYEAHSGTKMLGMSRPYSYRDTPDEWIVSPTVIGGQTVSFWHITYSQWGSPYYSDSFDICYSTGGTTPEDFQVLKTINGKYTLWTEITFELPVDATRFAIHVTAYENDGLLFDDFSFIKGTKPLELQGYNIYRNGEKIARVAADVTEYVDTTAEQGNDYQYTVTAVYDRGESLESATVLGIITGIDEISAVAGIRLVDGGLQVVGYSENALQIVDVLGRTVFAATVADGTVIRLNAGIYIVNGQKFAVK